MRASSSILALLLVLGLAGCATDLDDARDSALAYFAAEVESVDPGWAQLFGYMHRRFGLTAWDAAGRPLHEIPEGQERPEIAAIYRRLSDPSAGISMRQIAALPTAIDRITASALHCDRIPLPMDWPRVLRQAADLGGYALTHAAVASQWTLENGCVPATALAALQREQVDRLIQLVRHRDALAGHMEASQDIWIEAIAMLYYLGAGDRVELAWIREMVQAQRPDGSWAHHPRSEQSDPHTTALALWVLLEQLQPDAPPISWVPPRG